MRLGTHSKRGRVVQQPHERLRRLIKYNEWLEEGERITTIAVAISPVTVPPLVIDDIVLGPDSDKFAYFTSGGVSGEDYTATFSVTTSVAQTREDEVLIGVREVERG